MGGALAPFTGFVPPASGGETFSQKLNAGGIPFRVQNAVKAKLNAPLAPIEKAVAGKIGSRSAPGAGATPGQPPLAKPATDENGNLLGG